MPSVFLSYSSQQLPFAQHLESALESKGVKVWRDKTNLHAGERWPKALGDAIADSDALVLLWSTEAKQSDFVELEWNIAVAMKKPAIPCLMDDTSLPPTLKPSHCISGENIHQAVAPIMAVLIGLPPSALSKQQEKILETLDTGPTAKPQQVLKHLNTVINQPNWSVGGNVYQAQGDIHIGTGQSSPTKKPLIERWQTWVGLLVGILTILTLLVQLKKELPPVQQEQSQEEVDEATAITEPQLVEQVLEGSIRDKNNALLEGVTVTLPQYFPQPGSTDVTNQLGRFRLTAKAAQEAYVEFQAEKDGFLRYEDDLQLGTTTLSFTMKRGNP